MKREQHPISNIQWIDTDKLKANDYNPNVVMSREMKLLKFSLLKNGWIQPILISKDMVIIDGFHRHWLSHNDKDIIEEFGDKCPCVVLDIPEAERMLLTVRINRAKGVHVALKMHELIMKLHNEMGVSKKEIAKGIGASMHEVDTLLQEGVFSKLEIGKHEYSKAWYPK